MRAVAVVVMLLWVMGEVVGAQEVEEAVIWYWGIDPDSATLVAYNAQGKLNQLDVPLDPLDPQALIWRVDEERALALVEVGNQLLLYELSSDSATMLTALNGS